jgi:hypothetical protein
MFNFEQICPEKFADYLAVDSSRRDHGSSGNHQSQGAGAPAVGGFDPVAGGHRQQ